MTASYENAAFGLVARHAGRFVARALLDREFFNGVTHIRYGGSHVLNGLLLSFLP